MTSRHPVLVFLDFDGVLRRLQSPPSRFDQDCRLNFESVVRESDDVQIVIASSWRLAATLDAMRALFSADIGARIVGTTPEATQLTGYYRYEEVRAYLSQSGRNNTPWLAIDDHRGHYPADVEIVVTDGNEGFGLQQAAALRAALERLAKS